MSGSFKPGLLLAVLTLTAFSSVCSNDFIDLDDEIYVTDNERVKSGLNATSIRWAFTTTHANFWHPLTWLSLQLDATLFPDKTAWGFHLTNLVLHLANVLLLYAGLHYLTKQMWPSFWVAALFAVHPLHVESVAWVTERKDVLSTLFWLLALGAYIRYAERPGWRRMTLVLLPFALGLMTKPMLITLPFTLLLLDYWPLQRWTPGSTAQAEGSTGPPRFARASLRTMLLEKAPLFLMTAAFTILTVNIQRESGVTYTLEELPLRDRFANAVTSYGWYLLKTFLPIQLGLFYPHPFGEWSALSVVLSGLLLAGLTSAAVLTVRRHPYVLVGWLWFVGTLVPVIGLVQTGEQARADRFVYVPHIGLFVALVWTAAELGRRYRWSAKAARGWAGGAIAVLGFLTWLQVRHWKNTVTVWEHTLAVTTENRRALGNLGAWYAGKDNFQDLEKACRYLEASLKIREDNPDYHHDLGLALARLNRTSEAIHHYQRSLALKPRNFAVHNNLGAVLARQGQTDLAIEHFRLALAYNPGDSIVHYSLGLVLMRKGLAEDAVEEYRRTVELKSDFAPGHHELGIALLKQGKPEVAEEHLRRALKLNPGNLTSAHFLGLALARQQKWPQAIDCLTEVAPYQPVIRCALAYALYQKGDREAARMEYARVTQLLPQWPAEFAARAVQLATQANATLGDLQEALELAQQACQATEFPDRSSRDTLKTAQDALDKKRQAMPPKAP